MGRQKNLPLFFACLLVAGYLVTKGSKGVAQAVGTTSGGTSANLNLAGVTGVTPGSVPITGSLTSAPAAVQKMFQWATAQIGTPYSWGGGHTTLGSPTGGSQGAGFDCSGFVSGILGAACLVNTTYTTQTLVNAPGIISGPGKWVTIYDRTDSTPGNDHVIIDIAGAWFEEGGGALSGGNGNADRIPTPPTSYLSTFNRVLHPSGY